MMRSAAKRMSIAVAAVGAVMVIVGDVHAQGQRRGRFGGRTSALFLLGTPEVQNDLKLSDEQKQKVESITEDQRSARQSLGEIQDREERNQKRRELSEKADAEVKKVLNEEQQKRLGQIELQQAGRSDLAQAVLREAVAAKLKLTGDQKEKIGAIQRETASARRELFQGLRDATQEQRQEAREKSRKLSEEAREKTLAALSSEQKEAWTAMLGKPLEIEFRPRRRNQ